MTSNQVKRLKALTRHNFTEPTFWREKKGRRNGGKTADELVEGLDWDINLHNLRKMEREHTITAKFSADLVNARSAELEEENQVLKRQLQLLLEQVATGEHKLPPLVTGSRNHPPHPPNDSFIRPSSSTSSYEGLHGMIHSHASGAQTDRAHYNFNRAGSGHGGSQTDRGHHHSDLRSPHGAMLHGGSQTDRGHHHGDLRSPHGAMLHGGSQTDRGHHHSDLRSPHGAMLRSPLGGVRSGGVRSPLGHRDPLSESSQLEVAQRLSKSKKDTGLAAAKRNARDSGEVEAILERERLEAVRGKRDAEKHVAALERELKELRIQKLHVEEKVWTLEECLGAKDADLDLKQLECDHLRYMVGVKEGDEAQLERQLEYAQGHPFDEIYIEAGDEPIQAGKALMRRAENEAYKMEEYLKEMEEHLKPEEEEEQEAAYLVEKCKEEERRRRMNQQQAMEYRGINGEYLLDGCPICHRLVMVADKEVECHLIDEAVGHSSEDEEEPQQVEVARKKKKVRRAVGVPHPFDQIVTNTERWLREKPTRVTMLTDKKILREVTAIFCEKVVADATDDYTGTKRAVMRIFVYEHFLSVYGVRSLSDFYLLELLEGIKMFHEQHPRIRLFAQFCELQFAGPAFRDMLLDFFLEMWKEFAMGMKNPSKNVRQNRAGLSQNSGSQTEDMHKLQEQTFIIDAKTKKDEKITAKRIYGWKVIRRAFDRIAAHKWFPPEYPTAEEIKEDALGIGQQEVTLDEILEYGMAQCVTLYNGRRERLQQMFHEADADGSGKLDYEEFKSLMFKLDNAQNASTVLHYFRECIEGQEDDCMDMEVFCDVMQRHKLDRPPAHSAAAHTLPVDPSKRTELLQAMFNEVTNSGGRVDLPGFVSALKKISISGDHVEAATAAFAAHAAGAASVDLELFSQMMLEAPVLEMWTQDGLNPGRAVSGGSAQATPEMFSRASSDGSNQGWQ